MAARKKAGGSDARQKILHAVQDHAAAKGWEGVRLYQVAEDLDLPLSEVRHHYTDLNAVADAWFAQALEAMLVEEEAGFETLAPSERLSIKLQRWLDHLAPHRAVTVQMIRAKLHPPHAHHWVPMVFDLSRLIHWWMDAARIASSGPRRPLAEVGLTGIFLMTLAAWARDNSENQNHTRRFLNQRLAGADRVMRLVPPRSAASI